MYERVPISGIRESYCPASGPRTVVMPLIIVLLLAGLAIFYVKSEHASVGFVAALEDPLPVDEAEGEALPLASPPYVAALATEQSSLPLTRPDVAEKDFTPWMSSLSLDTYIRQRNRGYQGSFWSRGNWIRAIEGRYQEGAREFRIALGMMARPGEFQ